VPILSENVPRYEWFLTGSYVIEIHKQEKMSTTSCATARTLPCAASVCDRPDFQWRQENKHVGKSFRQNTHCDRGNLH